LAQGRVADCEARLGEALELAGKVGLKRELGNVHRVLAGLRAAAGDRAGTEAEFEQSVGIFRDLGRNYELACALLSRGRFLKETGDSAWQDVLAEALGLFESLGVEPGVKEIERLLAMGQRGKGKWQSEEGSTDILERLTGLACAGLDTARFCEEALSLIADRLPAEAAAILLRDGRVFQRGRMEVGEGGMGTDEVKGQRSKGKGQNADAERGKGEGERGNDEGRTGVGSVSIPLDVGAGRVGTLVTSAGASCTG
jgi:hypothetical protein